MLVCHASATQNWRIEMDENCWLKEVPPELDVKEFDDWMNEKVSLRAFIKEYGIDKAFLMIGGVTFDKGKVSPRLEART